MKTLLKIVAGLVGLIVVLLVLGSVLLRIYLPPEKAKALVLERLSAQLKREVSLGSVSIGIFTGLQMRDLKISESPNFSKGTFLSSEQFSLKVALPPLLFRKVIVRQIVLKGPEVVIVRNADGKTFNFSDLTQATTSQPAAEGKKESLPFLLLVSYAEIQKGALHFKDHSPAKQSVDIAPFDLKLKNVSLTAPFSVQTSLHVKSKGSDIALNFAGEANLLNGTFQIKQGSLVSQKTKLNVSGNLNRLKTSEPAVDLQVDFPQLNLADFATFVALPPEVSIEGLWSGRATVVGDQKAMKLEASVDGAKTKVRYAKLFSKPEKVPLSLAFSGTLKNLQDLELKSVKGVLASLVLTGHGVIQNVQSKEPSLKTHMETNVFAVEDVLQYTTAVLPEGVTVKGTNRLSADLSGTQANSQFAANWDATNLAIAQTDQFVKPAGTPLEVAVLGNTAGPAKIVFKSLSARLGANKMAGSGTYETRGKQSLVNFTAKGSNWSVEDLVKMLPSLVPFHPTGTLSFDLSANGPAAALQTSVHTSAEITIASLKHEFYEGQDIQMKWDLTQITPDLSKISGVAALKQGPGKILNVEKLAGTSRIGKIVLSPLEILSKIQKKGVLKQINLPSLESIPFDSVVGDYVLRSGTMDIKTFDLSGKDLSIQNRGSVGLSGAQALNLNVALKLAVGFIGGTLGDLTKDERGRPTFRFSVTGTVADPKVKLELLATPKKALEKVGEEILKNKDVKNAIEDLKGIFK